MRLHFLPIPTNAQQNCKITSDTYLTSSNFGLGDLFTLRFLFGSVLSSALVWSLSPFWFNGSSSRWGDRGGKGGGRLKGSSSSKRPSSFPTPSSAISFSNVMDILVFSSRTQRFASIRVSIAFLSRQKYLVRWPRSRASCCSQSLYICFRNAWRIHFVPVRELLKQQSYQKVSLCSWRNCFCACHRLSESYPESFRFIQPSKDPWKKGK